MRTVMLNGTWKFRILGDNVYGISNDYREGKVPGSVYGNLLELGLIPDPYDCDHELKALQLMENDFEFMTTFLVTKEMLEEDALLLRFDGIDTLANIYLNGKLLGHAFNMHRIWEYDILDDAIIGENQLLVHIFSPVKYIKEENEKIYAGGVSESMEGYPHLRKAHCMFGWDWGPRLPDAGIFRDVTLLIVERARFEQVYVIQEHQENLVTLKFQTSIEAVKLEDIRIKDNTRTQGDIQIEITVIAPDGTILVQNEKQEIEVKNPLLWWPHGYGAQPLYQVCAMLLNQEGKLLDVWKRKIGLRTVTMDTKADEWGNTFAHQVNGVNIFAMGADYIPEDNILSRVTKERTERLLRDCIEANHNCIRVWGGGYYPDDFFFDFCDELGLLVWQDFMYACASYELSDEFEANIRRETIENVRRIRHHACLGLWCGNNEMETQVLDKAWKPSKKQTYDYIKIFEYILPSILKEEDPNTFYWPSSPSSGGNFDNPWDENRGDTHYWDVWHGNKPFTEFRKFYFRYLSEFGFQSFPCLKTVESFTREEDRNLFSRVMEMHQRNRAANGKILNYLSATYLYPKDFDHLLYASQLLQADAIRYGVEHFRRHRGRCMGTVVWQLNDIWPVASWSSIDYFGRWKALHYAEKRMFAPILISCQEIGELSERPYCIEEPKKIEKSVQLNVSNETRNQVSGTVSWALRDSKAVCILTGCEQVSVPALSSVWLEKMDFSSYDELETYFSYELTVEGEVVSSGTCLFTAPKHFKFKNPNLTYTLEGNQLTVKADCFAKAVEIIDCTNDLKLSDDYFDMNAGEKKIIITEGTPTKLQLRSVYDIAMTNLCRNSCENK